MISLEHKNGQSFQSEEGRAAFKSALRQEDGTEEFADLDLDQLKATSHLDEQAEPATPAIDVLPRTERDGRLSRLGRGLLRAVGIRH